MIKLRNNSNNSNEVLIMRYELCPNRRERALAYSSAKYKIIRTFLQFRHNFEFILFKQNIKFSNNQLI
jgi:hypothetical protein